MTRFGTRSAPEGAAKLSAHQVQDLKRLGVVAEQIILLDEAVGAVSPLISPTAPLQDVRAELDSLEEALRLARARMERLVNGPGLTLAEMEARDRLRKGSIEALGNEESLQQAVNTLSRLMEAV
ncbi:MAG TPA: hypothetical protein VLJ62_33800, partial [Burkholderiaceae bacterium]|nr:hypothetical protein [Burkholderiaceae bacterium]